MDGARRAQAGRIAHAGTSRLFETVRRPGWPEGDITVARGRHCKFGQQIAAVGGASGDTRFVPRLVIARRRFRTWGLIAGRRSL